MSVMATLSELPGNYAAGLELIDDAHAGDPKTIPSEGGTGTTPYELHYARKMTRWLAARCPDASPVLQLACRAQHFQRYIFTHMKSYLNGLYARQTRY
jgi:hypothetical protein